MTRPKTKFTLQEVKAFMFARVEEARERRQRQVEDECQRDMAALDRTYRLMHEGADPPVIEQEVRGDG